VVISRRIDASILRVITSLAVVRLTLATAADLTLALQSQPRFACLDA
jgi:hypothetical protein